MRGWLDAFGVDRGQCREVIEDAGELRGEPFDIGIAEGDAGQPGDVEDFCRRERHDQEGTGTIP